MPADAFTYNQRGDGIFGIPADEDGLLVSSVSHSHKSDKAVLPNRVGNTVGSVYSNFSVDISIDAYVPATGAWAETIGSAVTFANTFDAFIPDNTGGVTVVESVNVKFSNKDYKQLSLTAVFYPYIVETVTPP